MDTLDYRLLENNDISSISSLFIKRQKRESKSFPLINHKHLEKDEIDSSFSNLFTKNQIIGIGAFIKDELVGYMLATIIRVKKGLMAWVPYEGLAIRSDQEPILIKYLYAKVSELWVKHGCFYHSVYVPLGNSIYLDAFLNLSFSMEHAHAFLEMSKYEHHTPKDEYHIRLANKDDRFTLRSMAHIVAEYQNSSPLYLNMTQEMIDQRRNAFEKLVDEEDTIVFIAEKNNEPLGFSIYEGITPSFIVPKDSIELVLSGVFPKYMNEGIGKSLMNESVLELKKRNFSYIITDWKIANLSSSTFWPKMGFKVTHYRMVRMIDHDYVKIE